MRFYFATDKHIFDHSQDGTSEEFIGEWAEKRGIRDQLVIATKASPDFSLTEPSQKVLMPWPVYNQLQAGPGSNHSQGELLRESRKVTPHFRRSLPEETAHVVHRHLVCALVGLDHLSRGDYERTTQPGRSRKSTLFGAPLFPPPVRRDLTHTA